MSSKNIAIYIYMNLLLKPCVYLKHDSLPKHHRRRYYRRRLHQHRHHRHRRHHHRHH